MQGDERERGTYSGACANVEEEGKGSKTAASIPEERCMARDTTLTKMMMVS